MDADRLELSDFSDFVGETFVFSVEGVDSTVEGELIGAKLIKSDTEADREPFCVDFKFDPQANLGQSVYHASHDRWDDRIPIFLIPYKGDDKGWYMTAQFN